MEDLEVIQERFLKGIGALLTPGTSSPPAPGSAVVYRRMCDIAAKPIHWLWPGRFARGKVSMIAGNPGLGKSQITASLAATVTTGGRFPVDGTTCDLGNVVFLSAEDDPADTIRPRLEAARADLTRCYMLDAVVDDGPLDSTGPTRSFSLQTDLARLGTMLDEIGGAALIVIDPITAYLGGVDSHKNAEIRALLAPLSVLAEQHGAAVVCVSHLNKNAGSEALLRVTGSLAFVAAARAAYVVVKDSENDLRRLFLPLKNNVGNDKDGLAFTVQSAQIECPAGALHTSRVCWEPEAVTVSADAAMSQPLNPEDQSDIDEAKEFLQELLADGPVSSKQIKADADGAGHAWRTIRRAQKDLGVIAAKTGLKGGWTWQLSPSPLPEDGQKPPKMSTHNSVAAFEDGQILRRWPSQTDWPPSDKVGHLREEPTGQTEVEL